MKFFNAIHQILSFINTAAELFLKFQIQARKQEVMPNLFDESQRESL